MKLSFRKIDSNGVEFRSHLNGSKHYLTPENIVDKINLLEKETNYS